MEMKNCKVCGELFKVYKSGGSRSKCYHCVRALTKENESKKLMDLSSTCSSRQWEINQAKELLSRLGYDVNGDVHAQWLNRVRVVYGVSF